MLELPASLYALAAYPKFIVYRLEPSKTRPGKSDKIPCDYRTGKNASALDPANWTDANTAANSAEVLHGNYRVGFVLTKNDPFFCIDIDDCLQPDGQQSTTANDLCGMFSCAAIETSQSGRGRHIWARYEGPEPAHGCKNIDLGIELYTSGRFIALGRPDTATGNAAIDCTLELSCAIALYFQPKTAQNAPVQEWTTEPCAEWNGPTDDGLLIRRAIAKQSVNKAFDGKAGFADLWKANAPALARSYPDGGGRDYDCSSADAALAQHLAFWTGKNCERIRRLMEQSALVRDKWERKDYLPRTILSAVARQIDVLNDKRPEPSKLPPALTVPSRTPDELTSDDFYAYLPTHSYINRRTRELHPVDAINGNLRRFKDELGMNPALWLDMNRYVQQMSWVPGRPEVIEGMVSANGYLQPDPTGRIYNMYRPSDAVATDADPTPWLNTCE